MTATRLVSPLDAVRVRWLRLIRPFVAHLFADRAARVRWVGLSGVATSFLVSAVAPLWSIALGPIVLGILHLVADVRYLVVRPGLHRHGLVFTAVVGPLALVSLGAGPVWGLVALVPMVLTARPTFPRTALVLGAWLVLSVVAFVRPYAFQLTFLHLHNVVALGLWWWWRPRDVRAGLVVVSAALGTVVFMSGAADALMAAVPSPAGASFEELAATMAPLGDAGMAKRLIVVFAFLQSVHYVAWLRLIPEDDRPRPAPRPFGASLQAMINDFGLYALVATGLLAAGLGAWALADLASARMGYLRVAAFHGYLELAVAARWLASGRAGVSAR